VNSEDTGALGIVGLKDYWARRAASRAGREAPSDPADQCAENVLLAGLRLGIRETLEFLMTKAPPFEEFEAWVLSKNGGVIDAVRVERLNGALRGDGAFELESTLGEPTLSASELAFWEENGYVVVKNAVSKDAAKAAVDAIFEHTGMSMDDAGSWQKGKLWIPLAHHPALWANRNSARIHTAFAQVWGRHDLWINVDVCGVNPPLTPGRSFQGSPLHWDVSLAPPMPFGTQAILYLTDTPANQGAFSCVPGFHHQLETWLKELPEGADARAVAQRELEAIPIAGEAGDLIIWHHALPHGATPNRAALPRVTQYLNMFPSRFEVNPVWV
jgi:hypothetical protein